MYHVICPACGAMMEAGDIGLLVEVAREHTLDAHNYDIPPEHVRQAAQISTAQPPVSRAMKPDADGR